MAPAAVAPPVPGPSLWPAVAELPLQVDAVALQPLERETLAFLRRSTVVRLSGGGHEGLGEDVVYDAEAHPVFQAWDGLVDLRGRWTLRTFCAAVAAAELFPAPPEQEVYRRYRRWAFESAALDLALRQAGQSLAQAVGRPVAAMTFVSSRSVGDPPDPAVIEDMRRRSPGLQMKLDLGQAWDAASIARVRETGAASTVDLKGHYRGTSVDTPADPAQYRAVVDGLPDALIEDAAVTEETRPILAPHAARLTWDAPLHDAVDLDRMPFPVGIVNLKPSRTGSIAELSALYDACTQRGIGVYSGGQMELGVGRGQAQLLAALFHPDGPNDLAPTVFNDAELPHELPATPLTLDAASTGFRLASDV